MSTVLTDNFGIVEVLEKLGIGSANYGASTGLKHFQTKGNRVDSFSPVTGKLIASVNAATAEDYAHLIHTAENAFKIWRMIPAPKRGEIVRRMGDELRKYKN